MSELARAYLDNNATTRPAPEVVEALLPYLTERYANPSSMHLFGSETRKDVERAREAFAAAVGARASEIVFTSGGTEGDNFALRRGLAARPGRRKIVTCAAEHPAVLDTAKALAAEGAAEVALVGVDAQGRVDLDALRAEADARTALVSLMWANNETGAVSPISEAAAIAREAGALFHVDAVQALGKIPLDVKAAPIDLATFSGHKVHATKGVGALYVRRGVRLPGWTTGGRQERGLRTGTENVPGIVAMGRVAELLPEHLERMGTQVRALRDRLEGELLARVPGLRVNAGEAERVPNTTNIGFDLLEAQTILLLLSEHGICCSTGAACSTGSPDPSHVLAAMGQSSEIASGGLRFSLSVYTTEAEIDWALRHIPAAVAKMREIRAAGGREAPRAGAAR